jgi:uncharacterized repeat protein (TIGR02543 family)
LNDINNFIGARTYIDRKPTDLFQYFDIDKFIENNCNGLCYDWSCFTSIVIREISAHKDWQGITTLVVDAVSVNDSNSSHSFNFVVDENVYDTVATNGNETIKLPSNPVKDGYEFEGWYWDNGKWEKPFTVNSLLNTPLAADMSVYAKFTHKEHSFDKETVVAPTCTEKGYTLKECECGETTKTNYVLSVEHAYSDFEIRTEATTYSTGIKERICTVCGFVDKKIIPQVSVSFGVTLIEPVNPNLYVGEIDLPNLILENKYELAPLPDTLITELIPVQNTLIVKAED